MFVENKAIDVLPFLRQWDPMYTWLCFCDLDRHGISLEQNKSNATHPP